MSPTPPTSLAAHSHLRGSGFSGASTCLLERPNGQTVALASLPACPRSTQSTLRLWFPGHPPGFCLVDSSTVVWSRILLHSASQPIPGPLLVKEKFKTPSSKWWCGSRDGRTYSLAYKALNESLLGCCLKHRFYLQVARSQKEKLRYLNRSSDRFPN